MYHLINWNLDQNEAYWYQEAMSELAKAGVQFHSLSDDQLGEWQEAGGYQRSEWDSFKTELAGSMDNFAKMEEAAGTQGKYYVHDA